MLTFTKMHGLGNDYVYVDATESQVSDPAALARAVSDRHRGIGSDGLVLIVPSAAATVGMRMWNADGSESAMCGNALRCVARYAVDHGLAKTRQLTIETQERIGAAEVLDGGLVRASVGRPAFERGEIPMTGAPGSVLDELFEIAGAEHRISAVSVGNPHVVIEVADVGQAPVSTLGPLIERDLRFPERTNVEFISVETPHSLRMRVWERGTGETQACGSGAAAAAITAVTRGRATSPVDVHLLGGTLRIDYAEDGDAWMSGPATYAFEGVWPEADVAIDLASAVRPADPRPARSR